jgi:oxygen-dependent protoporphyrinogen oxidase
MRVIVVGGGISGLAAAHRLIELGAPSERSLQVMLLEADSRLGGVIRTERSDGFVIEAGPDSILTEHPWATALCDRIGLTPRMIRTRDEDRKTWVVHDGELHPLPEGFLLMAPTRFLPVLQSGLFSWPGKLRMALDLILPRGSDASDESLAHFVRRRLGNEALERVVQPLVGGIYTADPERLSLAATMPRFLEIERSKRSLILGMWSNQRRAASAADHSGARWSLFTSVDDGLQTLVDTLARRLPEGTVRLRQAAESIEKTDVWRITTSSGECFEADAVILATPAHHSARLLRSVDEALAREIEGVPYASSGIVTLAFAEQHLTRPLEGFGFVVPHVEGRSILACSYSSMKWPGRAPKGRVLVRAFVGGALQSEILGRDDPELIALVRRELKDLLGIASAPLLTRVARWMHSMPQYHVGHLQRLARIDQLALAHGTLHLAGNAYRGIGIPHCIHSGESAAERLLARR